MSMNDYDQVRKDIQGILHQEHWPDHQFIGTLLMRLAWHSSGTYSRHDGIGGSNGATMRFAPEKNDPDNNGLELAQGFLEPIKQKHPWMSYADLWTLAGVVAIEAMKGPIIQWKPGRTDKKLERQDSRMDLPSKTRDFIVPEMGRLPMASGNAGHVRSVFSRMGFNEQETVALVGAHCLGRTHKDRSNYDGPWCDTPNTFCNRYYQFLREKNWVFKEFNGLYQFMDDDNKYIMLPTDIAILKDPKYRVWVDKYAEDEALWMQDFKAAFEKLIELGVTRAPKVE